MIELDNEKSFEEMFEKSIKEAKLDKTVTGTIISITKDGEIFVDIGYKADGIIPKNEYSLDENANPKDEFKVGDKITADVVKQNDGLGNVLLSYRRVKQREKRQEIEKEELELEEKIKNNPTFEEKVKEVNDKGLVVLIGNKRVFIPLSLSGVPRGEDANHLKGQTVRFKIIEYDIKANKIIGSIKVLLDEEKKKKQEEFWNSVEIGKKYKGIVTSISTYGAFIELEGVVQGLLHVSELTWERNAKVSDILKQGQEIDVTIKEVDKENKRIKLGYLEKGPNPWSLAKEKYHINDILKVKVVKLMPFGAFVELEPGIEGLIHISEISERKIAKAEDELKIGQHVNAKIIEVDTDNEKIGLSIKELEGTSNEYKEEI